MPYPLTKQVHQVVAPDGTLVGELPDLADGELLGFYRWMLFGRVYSDRMVALQRQGRMGTFAPLRGQEASAAIATPLQQEDWLTGSYRELLPYFVKGVPPLALMYTYRGYAGVKYPHEARCLPMQIVLATQMLHAAGLAMAIKYEGKPNVAVGVCGDGATSEGDFNESLNFAAVFQAPFVAVVQNNGWAISVPRHYQTASEYIAHRGPAFGMPGYVVDGNDVLAVHKVMADCVERARAGEGPSLLEMLTYRVGAHTTADDPTKYQPQDEVDEWRARDPLLRYRKFLRKRDLLSDLEDEQLHEEITDEIQAMVEKLEATPPQDPAAFFDLVYAEPTKQLKQQRAELLQHLGRES